MSERRTPSPQTSADAATPSPGSRTCGRIANIRCSRSADVFAIRNVRRFGDGGGLPVLPAAREGESGVELLRQ